MRRVRCAAFVAALGAAFGASAAHAADSAPQTSPGVESAPFDRGVFKADPTYTDKPYDAQKQIDIYGGKTPVDAPRPVIELGRPLYREGPIPGGFNVVGRKNLVNPSLTVFGDWRNAIAYNDNGKAETGVAATRLNLDADLQLTSTERIHALFRPLDQIAANLATAFSDTTTAGTAVTSGASKGFDLDLPLGRLVVVTGLSGAGKSSLVFETLHAEGQRRYVETFSAYTRQFLDLLDKPLFLSPKLASGIGEAALIVVESKLAAAFSRCENEAACCAALFSSSPCCFRSAPVSPPRFPPRTALSCW